MATPYNKEGHMPTARKNRTKKDSDSTPTRKRKPAKEVEEEVLADAEDEDLEESESTTVRRKITPEIAERAAEMREEGATWTEVIEETGFNGAQLRPHIARLTEAKIDTLEDSPESVAEHREDGYAWYAMAISLGKTISEVKEMAEEGGAEVEGRKYRSNGAEDAEEAFDEDMEDDDEDEDEEDAPKPKRSRSKAASKPAASKAKSADKPKAAAGKRRRKANPSEED